jgi:haloacetate dehalogenase
LWGKKGVIGKQFNSIKIWQKGTQAKKFMGMEAIDSGHFIPEQNPQQAIVQLRNFFLKQI